MSQSANVMFNFYLGDNLLLVEALVTKGRPQQPADMTGPGEPAEDPDIELEYVGFCPPNGNKGISFHFDVDSIYVMSRNTKTPIDLYTLIKEQALEEFIKWQ
jgi:hypothetical protein